MNKNMKTCLQKFLNHKIHCTLRYGAENTPYSDALGYLKEIGDDYICLLLDDITDGYGSEYFDEVIGVESVVSMQYLITAEHFTDCPVCKDAGDCTHE